MEPGLLPLLEAFQQSLAPDRVGAGHRRWHSMPWAPSSPLDRQLSPHQTGLIAGFCLLPWPADPHQAGGGVPQAGLLPARIRHHGAQGKRRRHRRQARLLPPAAVGWQPLVAGAAAAQQPAALPGTVRLTCTAPARLPSHPVQLIMLDSVPVEVRQAAAVNFKNHVKFHWAPKDTEGLDTLPVTISDPEKVRPAGWP